MLAIPFFGLFLAGGLITLPIGIRKVVRRRLNPLVLRCPSCRVESRQMQQPFSVKRWYDVDYAFVVCSYCGKDFTVPADARLI